MFDLSGFVRAAPSAGRERALRINEFLNAAPDHLMVGARSISYHLFFKPICKNCQEQRFWPILKLIKLNFTENNRNYLDVYYDLIAVLSRRKIKCSLKKTHCNT